MRKELLLCLILLLAVFAHAQTPNTISFQGNLTTPGTENPIADGTYSMDFELFDDVNNPMWSETQPTVQVTNGLINVLLGSVTPLQIDDFYQPLYLQITIDGETLTPQIALQAVPFAQTSKAVVGTDSIVFRILDQKAGIVDQTNTALGFFSFTNEQGAGFFNEAFGVGALENNNGGSQNVAIGSYSLGSNTNGNTNIAIGYQALNASTTSSNNVAVGPFALQNNTDGFENLAIGSNALSGNTIGQRNIGVGLGSITTNTLGNDNVGVGVDALNQNLEGNENTAMGSFALEKSTGTGNTAIGGNALRPHVSGDFNVAIGFNTGSSAVGVEHVNGNYNTLIGTDASVGVDGLTNASAIGFGAVVSQNNSMVLGNASVNVGIGTSSPAEKLDVNGTVRADAFEYSSPVEEYYFLSGLDFKIAVDQPSNTLYLNGYDKRYLTGGTAGNTIFVVAPFNLPHGSTITQIDFFVYDADVTYDITQIRVYSNGTTGGYPVSGLFNGSNGGSSSGSSGNQTITSSSLSITINNTNQGYWLYALMSQATTPTSLGIYGARITYLVDRP